ncbi:hypothetical protein BST61_g1258 [Cercospora zeina]
MATAAERAFHVAELLERILLSLLMKDILLNQRVSKFWKALVKNSPKLQQALFYWPDHETQTWMALDFDGLEYIGVEYSIMEAISSKDKQNSVEDAWHQREVVGRFNELLLSWCGTPTNSPGDQGFYRFSLPYDSPSYIVSDSQDSDQDGDELEWPSSSSIKQPNKAELQSFRPSWCDMYLSQPPSTRIEFPNLFSNDENFADGQWGQCKDEEAITAGMLLERMREKHDGAGLEGSDDVNEGYVVEIQDPITAGRKQLVLDAGIRDFKKLEELTGSKSKTVAACKHMGDNLRWMRRDEDFAKVVKYGLLDAITEKSDVEGLIWGKEHLPVCEDLGCDGCSVLFHAVNEVQEDDLDEE